MNSSIPWWTVETSRKELRNVRKVLQSGYLNEGQINKDFETKISNYFNISNVITSTSGTTALYLSLKALGIGPGDLVAVPNLTFIATANAVKLSGASVLPLDVDIKTMTISNEEVLRAERNEVKAIIPVHVSGRSAWNRELRRIRKNGEIILIEDAAEAMGSRDPESGEYLGTLGNCGIFSLSPNKILTTGQGGLIVTNSDLIANTIRALKDQGRPKRGTGGADKHDHEGYNFKFTNLQAAVGLAQFESFASRIEFLSQLYKTYREKIIDCPHQRLFDFQIEKGEFPLWPEMYFTERKAVINKLFEAKIGFREVWLPINSQKPYADGKVYSSSKKLSDSTLWLPSSFSLTKKHIKRITKTLTCQKCFK